MDLHIYAVKNMKCCFMLCKHVANQENGASKCYKILKSGYIYVHFDCFWVLESNGIHLQILSNENSMLTK